MPRPPKNKAIPEQPVPVAMTPTIPAAAAVVAPSALNFKAPPVIDVGQFIRVRDSVSCNFTFSGAFSNTPIITPKTGIPAAALSQPEASDPLCPHRIPILPKTQDVNNAQDASGVSATESLNVMRTYLQQHGALLIFALHLALQSNIPLRVTIICVHLANTSIGLSKAPDNPGFD